MNKFIEISLIYIIFTAIVVSGFFYLSDLRHKEITSFEININDCDSLGFVIKEDIESILKGDSVHMLYGNVMDCNVGDMERAIEQLCCVDVAEVFVSNSGVLHIDVKVKNIIFNLLSYDGRSAYIDDKGDMIKIDRVPYKRIHVISCPPEIYSKHSKNDSISDKTDKNNQKDYIFLNNLVNFVSFINDDPFWLGMIAQININQNEEIELSPRVDSHKVTLCDVTDASNAGYFLQKLLNFYKKELKINNLGVYANINTKFDKLVVATKYKEKI